MDTDTHWPFDTYLDKLYLKFPNQLSYYYFKNGFSEEECDTIVNTFVPQCTDDAQIMGDHVIPIRRTKICWIPRNSSTNWIYDRLVEISENANENAFKFDLTGIRDKIQFALYEATDNGHYDKHVDLGAGDIYACRKLSLCVQLSSPDDYTGGELKTSHGILPSNKGAVSVFSSFLTHEVMPVTTGKRYSLVLWIYGPPFR